MGRGPISKSSEGSWRDHACIQLQPSKWPTHTFQHMRIQPLAHAAPSGRSASPQPAAPHAHQPSHSMHPSHNSQHILPAHTAPSVNMISFHGRTFQPATSSSCASDQQPPHINMRRSAPCASWIHFSRVQQRIIPASTCSHPRPAFRESNGASHAQIQDPAASFASFMSSRSAAPADVTSLPGSPAASHACGSSSPRAGQQLQRILDPASYAQISPLASSHHARSFFINTMRNLQAATSTCSHHAHVDVFFTSNMSLLDLYLYVVCMRDHDLSN